MKKVLGLLFISASIFSMQVATIGNQCERAKKFHYQLVKHHSTKPDMSRKDIKQQAPKLNIDIKDCIQSKSVSAPKGLGEIKLYHGENGFHVEHKGKMYRIESWFTDKLVRKATPLDIKGFQKVGKGYFAITQMGNGQFELKVMDRIKGGGILGAMVGATIGKVGVSVIGHGAIFLISGLTGPAAPYTMFALESYFGAAIELASIKGAVTCGLIGAVASGPV